MTNENRCRTVEKGQLDEVVYLDYHATTPCDPRVATVVHNSLVDRWGNPSSQHYAGQSAEKAISRAREKIASHIGALPGEIVFTSGATESNNIVLQGLYNTSNTTGAICRSSIEHKSVINSAEWMSREHGKRCSIIPVDSGGRVDLDAARDVVDQNTAIVSVQLANNELGTVQPIRKLTNIAHQHGALMHTDASQALGRLNIDVSRLGIDLLSISSHKAYGPKGVGALYIRGGAAKQPVRQIMFGGGQEHQIRPGTQNVPAIEGFGEAVQIIEENLEDEIERYALLRDTLENELLSRLTDAEVVGDTENRVASSTNIRLEGVLAEAVLARLQNVAASTGSACESGAPEPSHVLQAIGLEREEARECIRLAVGRFTKDDDIEVAVCEIVDAVQGVRSATKI